MAGRPLCLVRGWAVRVMPRCRWWAWLRVLLSPLFGSLRSALPAALAATQRARKVRERAAPPQPHTAPLGPHAMPASSPQFSFPDTFTTCASHPPGAPAGLQLPRRLAAAREALPFCRVPGAAGACGPCVCVCACLCACVHVCVCVCVCVCVQHVRVCAAPACTVNCDDVWAFAGVLAAAEGLLLWLSNRRILPLCVHSHGRQWAPTPACTPAGTRLSCARRSKWV